MSAQSKGGSVTRTVRLEDDIDSVVRSEAERQGMSTNALINKILLQYKDALRFDEQGSRVTITRDTFTAMIDKISNEDLEDVAYDYGSLKVREHLMRRGMTINYENSLWHIGQLLGEYSGWFRCEVYKKEGADALHLNHSYGRKWSHFISNYLKSIIQGELDLEVQSIILENDVHLTILK